MFTAIIQARFSSSRLPGKVLKTLRGKSMLEFELNRLKKSKKITNLIVATSTDESDDAVEALAIKLRLKCFRGSLLDVLDRFYGASQLTTDPNIIRLTGDCPFHDPELIDAALEYFESTGLDFLTNTVEPKFPDGFDFWVFKRELLEEAWAKATKFSDREHVTTYMINNRDSFNFSNYSAQKDYSHLRLTVDEAKDFELISKIAEYFNNDDFNYNEIIDFLEKNPELAKSNTQFKRDEGLDKSIQKDSNNLDYTITKSLEACEKAKKLISGRTGLLSKRPDMFSEGAWPGYFSKAQGAFVWDLDDNRYIDMSIGGIGATVLGYAHPEVDQAVKKSIANGVASSLNCIEELELAEKLISHHPWANKARFTRSGGEAMTVATRVARAYSNKEKIAFCGYHGWHDWYLAANLTKDSLGGHLLPGLEPLGVPESLKGTAIPFGYNNFTELLDIISKNEIGAIIMEPIRNIEPENNFLENVRKLATDKNIPLIFDEISAGYRIRTGGAHLSFNVIPDIAVFSKAIGNGYPIGAVIGKSDFMNPSENSFISSTCWTERVGPTAALATINFFEKNNVGERLVLSGEAIQLVWKELAQKHDLSIHIGGLAPLSHFAFDHQEHLSLKALYIQFMQEQGFLASNIFYAMDSHLPWHIEAYKEATDLSFEKIKEIINQNKINESLKGKPANAGFKRLT